MGILHVSDSSEIFQTLAADFHTIFAAVQFQEGSWDSQKIFFLFCSNFRFFSTQPEAISQKEYQVASVR